ncbi:MAG: hypothetical protein DI539_00320 [Flavobacterium psychrophilum]|nr:MAG: hypothetical protein DI539_00320 [Flavobacterium psychrophilum]
MRKHVKLRLLLLLMALFMLANCSEEHDVIVKANAQQTTSKKKHRILHGSQALEKRGFLINNLKKEGERG